VYYITNTQRQETVMDIIRKLEARDWLVAVIGFIAGAIIF
jgi:allophanate hydrolase subunit 1